MSTLLMDEGIFSTNYVPHHNHSRVLKSRENINKLKCNKLLKKKLKKYKLRKDGKEDPDIIDVSRNLINSLRIKSPKNQHFCSNRVTEGFRPHNYLTKMVRLKKTVTVMEPIPTNVHKSSSEIEDESISLTLNIDQDKRQTDAFKLLMDSRNKSIGSNSPGKDKCHEDSVGPEKADSKELRTKRILSLSRMAQAKGSLKKLEMEEYREENIKRKMENRAKRFKDMIIDASGKTRKRDQIKPSVDKLVKKSGSPITPDVIENNDTMDIKIPVFKTFDLFKDMKVNLNSNVKKISKEDEEFLKKLSPSIRKRENMLCYFQKLSKESDALQNDGDTGPEHSDELIMKVKLKSRKKVMKKKIRHITAKVTNLIENHKHDLEVMNRELRSNNLHSNVNRKKRKRSENSEPSNEEFVNNNIRRTIQCHNDRPKRNTKKPVKYTDDFKLISSDEELHIFTPKKNRKEKLQCESTLKKSGDNSKQCIKVENCKIIEKVIETKQKKGRDVKKKPPESKEQKNLVSKKATKLAPIFVSKPLLDSAAVEAKQKFLQSGVPSQLKKSSTNQTSMLATDEFQKVVHIQQLNYVDSPVISDILNSMKKNYAEDIYLKEEKDQFKKLLQITILENFSMPKFQNNVHHILQNIKKSYPKFPVYRTYHLLRGKSKGEFKDCVYPDLDNSVEIFNNIVDTSNIHPDKLNWADKYKPSTEKQVIGNFESIRELRRWLITWTENDAKLKRNKCGSDSSDFYQSDTDSKEAIKNENNLLIITGKVGTGKTLSVYAVAAELAIKVIEVNASTKRTGKIMLQDLQEATQSHKVDRGKNSIECSQKSQELCTGTNLSIVTKKRGRKKKAIVNPVTHPINSKLESAEPTVCQDNVRTGISLILIDDADIVFDQDDGFCNAISQLIQSSKRPVILVTSSLTCPHLQKFSSLAKIIKMRPFLPRMLGTWLDIMCLVDNNMCSPGLGAKTLDLFKGDIRKTINYLQFYMTSQKLLSTIDNPGLFQDDEINKLHANDENSCVSWGDNEGWGDKIIGSSNSNDIYKYFMNTESQTLHFLGSLNSFYLWWNLPNLLDYSQRNSDHTFKNFSKKDKTKEIKDLNMIATVLDNVSMADYLGTVNEEPNITSRPLQSFERDSVLDSENFATYNRNNDCINEISWEVVIKGIAEAQRIIDPEMMTEMNFPSMSVQRKRDSVVSRHKTLTDSLNPSTALDRRALALDYWSSCRNICRTEKSKINNSSKRNNRFCHYLKSLNIVCRNEYFDNLGESLSTNN